MSDFIDALDMSDWVRTDTVYAAYLGVVEEAGGEPLSRTMFGRELAARGVERKQIMRNGERRVYYRFTGISH